MSNEKKRKIMLVIEDVGNDQFAFTMQGDCERIGSKEVGLVPTAAEHWAIEFFNACQERIKQGNAKKLNREERRRT